MCLLGAVVQVCHVLPFSCRSVFSNSWCPPVVDLGQGLSWYAVMRLWEWLSSEVEQCSKMHRWYLPPMRYHSGIQEVKILFSRKSFCFFFSLWKTDHPWKCMWASQCKCPGTSRSASPSALSLEEKWRGLYFGFAIPIEGTSPPPGAGEHRNTCWWYV